MQKLYVKFMKIFKIFIILLLLLNVLSISCSSVIKTHHRGRKSLKDRSFKLINNKTKVLANPLLARSPEKHKDYSDKIDGDHKIKEEINKTNNFNNSSKVKNVEFITDFKKPEINLCILSSTSSSIIEPPPTVAFNYIPKLKTTTADPEQDTKFYPIKEDRRPPLSIGEIYSNDGWTPIVYAPMPVDTSSMTTTKTIVKERTPSMKKPNKIRTVTSSSSAMSKPKYVDVVDTTSEEVLKEEDFVLDLREKLDALTRRNNNNNNYYQAFRSRKKGQSRKPFLKLKKGVIPDTSPGPAMNDLYNTQKGQNEDIPHNDRIKTILINNNNVTNSPPADNSAMYAGVEERPVTRRPIIDREEMNNRKQSTDERKRKTWLKISKLNSTSIESNQFINSAKNKIEQQLQHPLRPMKINEITWPATTTSSLSTSLSPNIPSSLLAASTMAIKTTSSSSSSPPLLSSASSPLLKENEMEKYTAKNLSLDFKRNHDHLLYSSSTLSSVSPLLSTPTSPTIDATLSTSKTTICVPMLVHEKTPANPEVLMDVERVVCFPLPPEMNFNYHRLHNDGKNEEGNEEEKVEYDDGSEARTKKGWNDQIDEGIEIVQTEFENPELASSRAKILQKSSIKFWGNSLFHYCLLLTINFCYNFCLFF